MTVPELQAVAMAGVPADARVRAARRGLAVFFAAVVLGSGICEGLLIRTGKPIEVQPTLVMVLMWMPAVAALLARLALREGFSDVSFGFSWKRGWRPLLLGWFQPVMVGGLAYGTAWLTGLASFAVPEHAPLAGAPAAVRFAASLGLGLTLITGFAAITAVGEELGWRGYMLTRLVDSGVKRPILLSGLIWGAWHLPMIISGQYAAGPHPLLSAALFLISVTSGGAIAARVRLQSGSVWNAVIQAVFDTHTAGAGASRTESIWIGESGILVVAFDVAVVVWLMRRPWPAYRRPKDEPMGSFSLSSL